MLSNTAMLKARCPRGTVAPGFVEARAVAKWSLDKSIEIWYIYLDIHYWDITYVSYLYRYNIV